MSDAVYTPDTCRELEERKYSRLEELALLRRWATGLGAALGVSGLSIVIALIAGL